MKVEFGIERHFLFRLNLAFRVYFEIIPEKIQNPLFSRLRDFLYADNGNA